MNILERKPSTLRQELISSSEILSSILGIEVVAKSVKDFVRTPRHLVLFFFKGDLKDRERILSSFIEILQKKFVLPNNMMRVEPYGKFSGYTGIFDSIPTKLVVENSPGEGFAPLIYANISRWKYPPIEFSKEELLETMLLIPDFIEGFNCTKFIKASGDTCVLFFYKKGQQKNIKESCESILSYLSGRGMLQSAPSPIRDKNGFYSCRGWHGIVDAPSREMEIFGEDHGVFPFLYCNVDKWKIS